VYSSTLFLTLALDGVGGQRHAPAALPPGKTRYSLYGRLVGPQDRSERVRKISPPARIPTPGRPTRNKSLHRVRLTVPHMIQMNVIICSSKTRVQGTEKYAGLDGYVNRSNLVPCVIVDIEEY
jgi:hypothetical protein